MHRLQVSIPYRYGITLVQKSLIGIQTEGFNSLQVRYYELGLTDENLRALENILLSFNSLQVRYYKFPTLPILNGLLIIRFQFLIGTVLQQYFRHFPALSSFFVSNLFKKSVDLTFLLSQISLKNQAFFKKIFFHLGRQTFLHFFKIFIAFSFVFSYFDCRFSQYFQGFQDRQTF